jgi:hypothetical protein
LSYKEKKVYNDKHVSLNAAMIASIDKNAVVAREPKNNDIY